MEWIAIYKRNFLAWRKDWYGIIFSSIETLITIIVFAIGFNNIIGEINGMKYVDFVFPSIVMISAMNNAFFETTYNSFSKLYYRKLFHSYLNTPAGIIDIFIAELLWATTRSIISSAISITIFTISGLVNITLEKLLQLVIMSFTLGLCLGGIGLTLTSISRSMNFFDYIFYIYISPIMFLSGTFFPISVFPSAVEIIVGIVSPLYHSVNFLRNNNISSMVYLILFISIIIPLGINLMKKRLIE